MLEAMSWTQFGGLLAALAVGFGMVIWLLLRLRAEVRPRDLLDRLAELERDLESAFARASADMAERVEKVKGDVRTDLADRLVQGFASVRETVDRQLGDGRAEQSRRLGETVRALEQKFDGLRAGTESRLETIRTKVDERLQVLGDQVQAKLEKNIQEGFAHFQKVQEHLKAAEEQLRNVGTVGQSINELNNLLKLPHLRGAFGEAELGRLLADFLPASAFEEQAVVIEGSRERVDAVVKFPQFRLPIDSKFNREQLLPLFATSDPQQLEEARRQLATTIRQQARDIAEKYIHPEHGTTDLALMFLPSETVYFEVIRNTELTEALHRLKVFPVSPNTLAITLRAIAMSISQYEFARNVETTLAQIRKAQESFGQFQKRFEEVGRGLDNAQKAYQTASGHLNRYANRVVGLAGEAPPELPAPEPPTVT